MTLIKLIPEDHIEALETEQHEKFNKMLDSHADAKSKSWQSKEQWLAIFARSLSPSVACKQAQVPVSTYRRWRNTDPEFCRALNQILSEAHDEMIGTAYARATGYLQKDPDTETGYQEDATGRPIRHGVSDRLAISLVNANQKAQQLSGQVNVTLNFGALGVNEDSALKHAATGSVIERESEETDTESDE